MRQMQQTADLERIKQEVSTGQVAHHQNLLNRYLNNEGNNGNGREKDIRLRQLRT